MGCLFPEEENGSYVVGVRIAGERPLRTIATPWIPVLGLSGFVQRLSETSIMAPPAPAGPATISTYFTFVSSPIVAVEVP